MELVKRYIHAVTRHLPAQQREDVAKELHATIEDMAASHSNGKKPTAKQYEAALIELGDPDKLAWEYGQTKRYLIGPKWYDVYVQLLKQLLIYIPAIVAIVVTAINLFEGEAIAASIVDGVGGAIATAIQICFWVTVGFIIAERTGANPADISMKSAQWKPADLPHLPKDRQISSADAITGMVGMAAVGTFLVIGFWTNPWSDSSIAVLNPDLWAPWGLAFLGVIIASVTLEAYKLKTGNWTYGVAISNVVINTTLALLLAFFVATQQHIINPEFIASMTGGDSATTELRETIAWGAGIAVAVTIIASIWSSIDGVRKAFQRERA
jgi:hypothetical protein